MEDPTAALTLQFLQWIAERPRTYADAMDAWRTSCPRLSVWEDALESGLFRVEASNLKDNALLSLTEKGTSALMDSKINL